VANDRSLDDIAALTADVPALLNETRVPAVAIALIRDAEPAWTGAFGVLDRLGGRAGGRIRCSRRCRYRSRCSRIA
jgi:hypothetical protein